MFVSFDVYRGVTMWASVHRLSRAMLCDVIEAEG